MEVPPAEITKADELGHDTPGASPEEAIYMTLAALKWLS
jgi:hypothetical protein